MKKTIFGLNLNFKTGRNYPKVVSIGRELKNSGKKFCQNYSQTHINKIRKKKLFSSLTRSYAYALTSLNYPKVVPIERESKKSGKNFCQKNAKPIIRKL